MEYTKLKPGHLFRFTGIAMTARDLNPHHVAMAVRSMSNPGFPVLEWVLVEGYGTGPMEWHLDGSVYQFDCGDGEDPADEVELIMGAALMVRS